MGFFTRMRNAMARFMYGRNGVDALGWATLVFILVLQLLMPFLHRIPLLGSIVHLAAFVLDIRLLYRLVSRNLPMRQAENEKFLRWWGPKQAAHRAAKARRADTEHKYIQCECGTYCRVPRTVGKIEMVCPHCGKKKIVKT